MPSLRTDIPGASTLGVTESDVEHARTEVARLESLHAEQQEAAVTRLHEMRDGVAEGATAPTHGQVEELFANADSTAAELDAARRNLARLNGQRYGHDAADQRPVERARDGGLVTLASHILRNEDVMAAMRDHNVSDLRNVELVSADEFMSLLRGGGAPMAAQFDGASLVPDDQSRILTPYGLPVRQPTLLSWVRMGTTESDTVPFVRQTVESGTVAGKTPGNAANEATITYTGDTEAIVDRLIGLPVPERNLEDNGRLQSLLEGRLTGMLLRDAESQVVAGDGTSGTDMTGIQNTSNINTYTRLAGESLAVTLHKAITGIRKTLFDEPNGIALTADDWETLVLERDDNGQFVNHGGPFSAYPMTVWNKRAAVAHVLGSNESIVGKWDEAEFVVRLGAQIKRFDQHSDYPSKRLVYLRGLYRATLVVETPQAFNAVDTTAA